MKRLTQQHRSSRLLPTAWLVWGCILFYLQQYDVSVQRDGGSTHSHGSTQRTIAVFAFAAPSANPLSSRSREKVQSAGENDRATVMARRSFWSLVPRGGAESTTRQAAAAAVASQIFDNAPLQQAQLLLFGMNALGYILTVTTKSHYHVDLLGTSAFAIAAWPSAMSTATSIPRVVWSARIVMAWSVKLAAFLFQRVLRVGHDGRLDEVLDSPYYAAGFWLYSWAWGALTTLPLTIGSTSTLAGAPLLTHVGAGMAVVGLLVETLADYQKLAFKTRNPGKYYNVGLWKLSQHPNWFGDIVLWVGLFLMNASALVEPAVVVTGSDKVNPLQAVGTYLWRFRRVALAFLSPAFMWHLFSGQATGRILPDSVEAFKKRYGYGKDPVFTNYVDTTPLIVPNPWQILFGAKTKTQ